MISEATTPFGMAVHSQLIADNVAVQSTCYDLVFNELAFKNLDSEKLRQAGENVKRIGIGKAYSKLIINYWADMYGLNLDLIKKAASRIGRSYFARGTVEMLNTFGLSHKKIYENYLNSVPVHLHTELLRELLTPAEFEVLQDDFTSSENDTIGLPIYTCASWIGVLPEELSVRDGGIVINIADFEIAMASKEEVDERKRLREADAQKAKKGKKRRGKRV